ncbi:GNAT family N-acetyltransferase [Halobaculum sp. CBA1158]|uniref:GNAT family N-acetyltransferase n=1 Tax=Halobaculum sp. CBA1158 TaxID=2904243 RepID=UPI001F309A0C|nr:GNAT family N-acetyltransferase [Halobaculum sp. CBA1158]UIO99632.1 GNAT family N-acetyltransferase [Halobaculum sp. CBA1158]
MTDPAIRPAESADAPALAALYRAAYGRLADAGFPSSAADADADAVRGWLAERECWVATRARGHAHRTDAGDAGDAGRDGDIVGAVQLRERDDWPCPEVCRLAVAPEQQRTGIGAALLDHAEGVVANRGGDRVRLRSFSDHPFLLDWYADRGYERIGLQELDHRPFDAPVLERRL